MSRSRRPNGAAVLSGLAALIAVSTRPALAGDTYTNTFDTPPSEAWSDTATTKAPAGEQFLGPFTNQSVTLTLTHLREHTHAVIALDLYVIGAWNGEAGSAPTMFTLNLDQSRQIMRASFSNDEPSGAPQTYPIEEGVARTNPPRRGAFVTDSLGLIDPVTSTQRDTTYRLMFNVRHSGPTLVLDFAGSGLVDPGACWGVDNVFVMTYTMDLDPSGAFLSNPTTNDVGLYDGSRGATHPGSNPFGNSFVPSGGGGGGGGGEDPSGDPPPTDPPTPVPTPGAGALFALAAARALRRPTRLAPARSARPPTSVDHADGLEQPHTPPTALRTGAATG
jgi:hypothetical protein